MKTKEDIIKEIQELFDNSEYFKDLSAESMLEEYPIFEDFKDHIYCEYISNECEFIYYNKAMEFLERENPSLDYALELAGDMGFECNKKLNSCILASILEESYYKEEFYDIEDELKDLWEEEPEEEIDE